MVKNIDKIIRTFDLAKSDRRDDAFQSIIIDILFTYDDPVSLNEIHSLIKDEYSLNPNKNELLEHVEILAAQNEVISNKEKFSLNAESKLKYKKLYLQSHENKDIRDNNIRNIINDISPSDLSPKEVGQIVSAFNEFLHECFLNYGSNAISLFLPNGSSNSDVFDENLIRKFQNQLVNQQHREVLKQLIILYPARLCSKDLDYLSELANKAESFFSLGLNKEFYDSVLNANILNWTLFVDTNFLYSVLDLHNHPENEACLEIVDLAKKNIGLKLKYLPQTYSELRSKKRELEETISKTNFTNSQLRALAASDSIDEYAKKYFVEKVKDKNTPHPSEKITFAQQILSSKSIKLFNAPFESLTNDETFLNIRYKEYVDYLSILNSARLEAGLEEKRQRDPGKIDHDVFLREAIIHLRGKNVELDTTKYYGLSLDKILLKFDKNILGKKKYDTINPTFFMPSYLLKRFRKLLPLDTDDYRRAFLTAISSNTFDSEKPRSKVAQRSVEYFKKLGIENEELILECLNDELFLKEFEEKENSDQLDNFIKSKIELRLEELDKTKQNISSLLEDKQSVIQTVETENKKLKSELDSFKGIATKKEQELKEAMALQLKYNEEILAKNREFELIKTDYNELKKDFIRFQKEIELKEKAEKIFIKQLADYNKDLDKYIMPKLKEYGDKCKHRYIYLLIIFLGLLIPPVLTILGLFLKFISIGDNWVKTHTLLFVCILIFLWILLVVSNFCQKFIDTQVLKDSFMYLFKFKKVAAQKKQEYTNDFYEIQTKPSLDIILQDLKKDI